jgi:NADH-quinone oxidoreductase subunit H
VFIAGIIFILVLGLLVILAPTIWNAIVGTFNFVFGYDTRFDPENIVQCRGNATCTTIHAFIFAFLVFFVVITGFAYTTLLERVLLARLQHRVGPNRVGPWGLLQPAADGVKLIFKEDIMPADIYRPVYLIAPILKAVPTFIVIAVIPLAPDWMIPWFNGKVYQVPMALADPNVGVLWILAITSLGTYGVVLAGWASNNKYAMLGGLRATAQMISYELSMGMTVAVPILLASSMSLGDIIQGQNIIYEWYIFQNPLAAAILFIALLAEVNRSPFDLPEAEQELTAGYMTEYSGMRFAAFMMAEYLGMIAISMVFASLFLGGYQDGFGLTNNLPLLGPLVIFGKVILLMMLMIWIRGTLPRIRYDRLMTFGWKIMLPLGFLAVAWSAISVVVGDLYGSPIAYGIAAGIIFVLIVGGAYLFLRASGETEDEDEYEDDPIITGERRGIGWIALQGLGGLLAAPFVMWDFTIDMLERLANFAAPEDDQSDEGDGGSSETAIEASGD